MKRQKSIDLHNSKVVSESNERGDVDDVLGVVPEMREEFDCPSARQPDHVAEENIPPRKMIATIV